ncbi:hypothetical protein DVB87_17135 [Tsukamurella tyrosinosolvens]|nr:hypothetical protein DVB87_17135 [Tsukamurella tyrosinosolvens]
MAVRGICSPSRVTICRRASMRRPLGSTTISDPDASWVPQLSVHAEPVVRDRRRIARRRASISRADTGSATTSSAPTARSVMVSTSSCREARTSSGAPVARRTSRHASVPAAPSEATTTASAAASAGAAAGDDSVDSVT